MRLIFAPLATADLEEIGDYIALDNPPRALSFIRELRAQCRKILDNPLAFPAREDLAPGLRVLPYGQYLIFYRPMDTSVHGAIENQVLAIGQDAQPWGQVLARRKRQRVVENLAALRAQFPDEG